MSGKAAKASMGYANETREGPVSRPLRQALADEFAEDLILSGLWLTERPDSAHTKQDGAD